MGRVKSLSRKCWGGKAYYMLKEKIKSPCYGNKYGHLMIFLANGDGTTSSFSVHRLVALHFIDNPENKPEVDHIDGNPQNNHVENLRWVTHKENMNNPIFKERHSEVMRNRVCSDELREKRRKITKERWKRGELTPPNAETRKIIGQKLKGRFVLDKSPLAKKVAQYDKQGNLIRIWNSLKEASIETNTSYKSMSQCCCGRTKSSNNFIWEYV